MIADEHQQCNSSCDKCQAYRQVVSAICDQASSPAWRDSYCAIALYDIAAIALEIDDSPNPDYHIAEPRPKTNISFASISGDIESRPFSDSSGSSSASASLFSTPDMYHEVHSPASSPGNASTYFTSPDSVLSDDPCVQCHICGQTFKGACARRNLNRHLKTAKRHAETSQFVCPAEECGKSFTREDNLGIHMRSVHNLPQKTLLRRCRTMKRPRNLSDEIDHDVQSSRWFTTRPLSQV